MKHKFDSTILRSYDIRGQFGLTLKTDDAFAIGAGFGHQIKTTSAGRVAVGRDGRLSSPNLSAALIDGLKQAGCKVYDIGIGPTPMLYYADRHLNCDGAIQVTGSHNPPDYNGFKIIRDHQSYFGDDIQNLGKASALGLSLAGAGTSEQISVFDNYIDRLRQNIDFGDFSIVWDTGNGAAGPAVDALVTGISGTHKTLFTDVDGRFPNHHPNPVDPETLKFLKEQVQTANADCGIGFDGDGDRIGVIDKTGRQVSGDLLTAFLSLDILDRHNGADILFDVKSSSTALDIVRRAGGKPHLWRTGHSHMKKRLKELDAPLAGEMSGHIFIADDFYGFDDALYAACRFLSQLAHMKQNRNESLTDFLDQLPPSFTTPECHIHCLDGEKFTVVKRLSQQINAVMPAEQINLIDGVRLTTASGWCLIRASNTEPALVARAEGENEAALNEMIQFLRNQLKAAGISWDGP
jgi:phosphomannomutase